MKSFVGIKVALLALVVLGLFGLAVAQGGQEDKRSISVTGSGEAAAAPDRGHINAGVQTLAPTVSESAEENQAVVERIMKALRDEGVDTADIQTADYSIWQEQQHDPRGTGESRIVGYRVNNTVRVTINDIDRLGKILAAVTNAGANTVHGISFSVKDSAALEARARAAAMADARSRAEALAELAGVKLGKVLSISMSSGGAFPRPMAGGFKEMAMSAAAPDISGGQLSVTVQVQLSYEIE